MRTVPRKINREESMALGITPSRPLSLGCDTLAQMSRILGMRACASRKRCFGALSLIAKSVNVSRNVKAWKCEWPLGLGRCNLLRRASYRHVNEKGRPRRYSGIRLVTAVATQRECVFKHVSQVRLDQFSFRHLRKLMTLLREDFQSEIGTCQFINTSRVSHDKRRCLISLRINIRNKREAMIRMKL